MSAPALAPQPAFLTRTTIPSARWRRCGDSDRRAVARSQGFTRFHSSEQP